MCQVGVSNVSSTVIGLSNNCKWVSKEASPTAWCHAVVHFEVKMSCYSAFCSDRCPERSRPWPVCHGGVSNKGRCSSTAISHAMSKTRTQLGPSCKA